MAIICAVSLAGCSEKEDIAEENYRYEIEYVFPDDTFISIIEGETAPKVKS